MRNRSPAKIAASSPPAAARISRNTLWSSSGSGGTSSRCSVASSSAAARSSAATSCSASVAQARVRVGGHRARRRQLALAPGEALEAARDRVDARELHRQLAEACRNGRAPPGSDEHALDLRVAVGDALEPAADRVLHGGSRPVRNRRAAASASVGVAALGRLAQRRRRRVQQAVRQRRRELLEHLPRGGWPAASWRRASASAASRAASAWPRSSRIIGRGVAHLEARHELGDVRVDQPARDRGLGLARLHVLVHDLRAGRRSCTGRRPRARRPRGSMSRGTARSSMNIGRCRRSSSARRTSASAITWPGRAVEDDDDVGLRQVRGQRVERDHRGREALGDALGAVRCCGWR